MNFYFQNMFTLLCKCHSLV